MYSTRVVDLLHHQSTISLSQPASSHPIQPFITSDLASNYWRMVGIAVSCMIIINSIKLTLRTRVEEREKRHSGVEFLFMEHWNILHNVIEGVTVCVCRLHCKAAVSNRETYSQRAGTMSARLLRHTRYEVWEDCIRGRFFLPAFRWIWVFPSGPFLQPLPTWRRARTEKARSVFIPWLYQWLRNIRSLRKNITSYFV